MTHLWADDGPEAELLQRRELLAAKHLHLRPVLGQTCSKVQESPLLL